MEYKDYYKILGVPKTADDKAIKTAYRRLARKHHPDVAKGKESAARFQEIAEAYEVLGDAEKRKRYDTLGPDWQRYAEAGAGARGRRSRAQRSGSSAAARASRTSSGRSSETWAAAGAVPRRLPRASTSGTWAISARASAPDKGGDVEAAIELSLEEAFRGVSRTISLELDEPCPTCGGSGHVNRKPCPQCHGGGWSKGRRNLEVKIPAGVDTGSRVRVAGEGQGGAGGGRRGDLYLKVTVRPDPRFERKGDDLYVDPAGGRPTTRRSAPRSRCRRSRARSR